VLQSKKRLNKASRRFDEASRFSEEVSLDEARSFEARSFASSQEVLLQISQRIKARSFSLG